MACAIFVHTGPSSKCVRLFPCLLNSAAVASRWMTSLLIYLTFINDSASSWVPFPLTRLFQGLFIVLLHLLEPAVFNRPPMHCTRYCDLKRLDNEIKGAFLYRINCRIQRCIGSHEDYGCFLVKCADLFQEFDPRHSGHVNVGQYGIKPVLTVLFSAPHRDARW